MATVLYEDRAEAGGQLASLLRADRTIPADRLLVLALPRGGVPIGAAIARSFDAPLDTLVVRKIGMPGNPEAALGAIAPGDVIVLDEAAVRALAMPPEELDGLIAAELAELTRRMAAYQSGAFAPPEAGRTIIIADDGLATGMSARAAIAAARLREPPPERIIFAVPVAAIAGAAALSAEGAEVVALKKPADLLSIGERYRSFPQLSDADVLATLERAWEAQLGSAIGV